MNDSVDADHDAEDFDALAAELAQDAKESFEASKQEQEEFLDRFAEEEGMEVLETRCTLVGDYTVSLSAKFNGEIWDAMGRIDARLERFDSEEGRAYDLSETAEETASILADVIDDDEYTHDLFYEAYTREGPEALGALLETVFEALKQERDRQTGAADGFRQDG